LTSKRNPILTDPSGVQLDITTMVITEQRTQRVRVRYRCARASG
jgi:hypothetical protein